MKFNNYIYKEVWNKMIHVHEKQGNFHKTNQT
jgi:hypothetical protein